MSPLRTSLEGFRLRSRSDLDTGAGGYSYHAERIRQERQKWQEKERAKELKREKGREKEDMKKRERVSKELHQLDREQALLFKEAEALVKKEKREKKEASRRSTSAEAEATGRAMDAGSPEFSAAYMGGEYHQKHRRRSRAQQERRRLETKLQKLNIPQTADPATVEKLAFVGRNYESTDQGEAPTAAQGVSFDLPRRTVTAKRKTQGAWTTFVLWFRTRVLRLQTKLEK